MDQGGTFRADIQGLRAVAVGAVLAFHATSGRWLPGGFAGVDVFFVISGFLITGILLGAPGRPAPSLAAFYGRRARRLLPALGAMLAFVLAAGAVLLPAEDYAAAGRMAAASLLFWSNMMLVQAPSYFDASGDLKPLQHTWSLGVEEQFYLLFPIFLAGVRRFAPRRRVAIVAAAAIVSLALSCILLAEGRPTYAFYTLPSRAFELLIGAVLALRPEVLDRIGARGRDLVSCAGLVAITGSFALIDPSTPFPGAAALAPCLGTAAVIASGIRTPALGGRIISGPPFLLLGAISYSLYLWHWPLLVFARYWALGPPGLPGAGLAVAAAVGIAWLSWRFVETPVLHAPSLRRRAPVFAIGAAALLAASLTVVLGHGLPGRFPVEARRMFAAREDHNHRRDACHADALNPVPYERGCVWGGPDGTVSVAVWGDSEGAELVVVLGQALSGRGAAALQLTASSCPPTLGYAPSGAAYCLDRNARIVDRLAADPRIDQVVLAARYTNIGDASPALARGLAASIRMLRGAGKQVIVLGPIPSQDFDPPTAIGMLIARGGDRRAWGLARRDYRRASAPFAELAPALAKRTGADYVDPYPLLCGSGFCPGWTPENGVLYFNATHLSLAGARLLVPSVLEQIDAAEPPVNRRPVGS